MAAGKPRKPTYRIGVWSMMKGKNDLKSNLLNLFLSNVYYYII